MVARRNLKITNICEQCGQQFHPWQGRPGRTCSRLCANAIVGRESALKRGEMQRSKGEGRTYRKFMGRHEHRVVAEHKIGRPLRKGEVVHHIDGNHLNNAPENLAVLPSQSLHVRIELTGKVCPPDCTCGRHEMLPFTEVHRRRISESLRRYHQNKKQIA